MVKGARDPANLKVEVSDPSIASVTLQNESDPRGAYYVVTAKGTGSVIVRVTENGQTSQFSLHVTAPRGSLTLDTDHYTMAPGNAYTIGAFLRDPNGEQLSSQQVQALIASGALSIRDSRTGSVVDMQLQEQGNVLLTAKNEGTCYILYDIEGQHMSVRVDVKNGAQPTGKAVRRSTYWM